MALTKQQVIVIGGVGIALVVFVLMGLCVIPGFKSCTASDVPKIEATLTLWSMNDTENAYAAALAAFKKQYKTVDIRVRTFTDIRTYERTLLDALAAGEGPDIFTVPNEALIRDIKKLAPVPTNRFPLTALRALFPQTVEADFVANGAVYALPAFIDSLAFIYNRDRFDAAATPLPTTWDDLARLPASLTMQNTDGTFAKNALALGGTRTSIPYALDTVSALMLQTNTTLVSSGATNASFASAEGKRALSFYLQFADAGSAAYTWNDAQGSALERFNEEKLAGFFGYASTLLESARRSPFVNVAVAPLPQIAGTQKPTTYARYRGLAVSKQSKYQQAAWDFILTLTTVPEHARAYAVATKLPPALRSLIQEKLNDPLLGVFGRQALIARAWPQIDPTRTDEIFSRMIQSAKTGDARYRVENALQEAARSITALMQQER